MNMVKNNKFSQKKTALSSKKISLDKSVMSVRAVAAQILLGVFDQGKSLSMLIPEYQSILKSKDLPLLQEICFGVCRVLPRLEQIIKLLVNKPLKGKARIVHCLLLVGLYQILYTRIPAHAAVDEVINATKPLKSDSFKGLLNGVLRNFLREQDNLLEKVDKHWQTLHPEWLVNKLKKAYSDWRDIIDANNQKPPMWLRVNLQKTTLENYRTLLQDQGIESLPADHPQALRLTQPCSVNLLPYFSDGWVSVQDFHAQWSALLLEPKNGELILDACAAPGGKTTHILEYAPNATVIALDVEQSRLQRVEENLQRMQQQARVICGDATKPNEWLPKIAKSAVKFDRILLDAPCSATGVIRRHPDIKWLRKEGDIVALTKLQSDILESLWDKLKVNGTLVYATCSLLPEENNEQIARFLQQHSDAKLEKLPFTDKDEIGHQFFPDTLLGDGFYYAKLTKLTG